MVFITHYSEAREKQRRLTWPSVLTGLLPEFKELENTEGTWKTETASMASSPLILRWHHSQATHGE